MSLFLSETELTELTGFIRPHCRARWLKENGFFNYKISADGKIKIARDYVLKVMGAEQSKKPTMDEVVTEPDWSFLDGPKTNKRQRPAAALDAAQR